MKLSNLIFLTPIRRYIKIVLIYELKISVYRYDTSVFFLAKISFAKDDCILS